MTQSITPISVTRPLAAILLTTFIAGCVVTPLPMDGSIGEAVSNSRTQTSTVATGNTTVTTSRTKSSYSGVGINTGGQLPQPAATVVVVPAAERPLTASDLVGTWQLQVPGERPCDIRLMADGKADEDISCPFIVVTLREWRYRGGDIQLVGAFDDPLAVLRPERHNRFTGNFSTDGTPVSLLR